MPTGRALYTQNRAEIKKSCARDDAEFIGGLFAGCYVRRMPCLTCKILRIAFAILLGAPAVPALAQSSGGYGLSGLKSYDAPIAPSANGLAKVIRSENQTPTNTPSKFKPDTPPVTIAIHGYGEVIVDSSTRP